MRQLKSYKCVKVLIFVFVFVIVIVIVIVVIIIVVVAYMAVISVVLMDVVHSDVEWLD